MKARASTTAVFAPTDSDNYNGVTVDRSITIAKATPVLTWDAPDGITYGTPLDSTQQNATSDVDGQVTYDPAPHSVLEIGQLLEQLAVGVEEAVVRAPLAFDQRMPDEELARDLGVDAAVGDRPGGDDRQAVQRDLLLRDGRVVTTVSATILASWVRIATDPDQRWRLTVPRSSRRKLARDAKRALKTTGLRGESRTRMDTTGIAVDIVGHRVEQHKRRVDLVVVKGAHNLGPESFYVSRRRCTLANFSQG